MEVAELGAQLHLKMKDGSIIVIQTPPLVPPDGTTLEQIREKIMDFGEDVTANLRAGMNCSRDPRIHLAQGGLRPFNVEGE